MGTHTKHFKLGKMVHIFNSSQGRLRHVDLYEFKTSVIYIVRARKYRDPSPQKRAAFNSIQLISLKNIVSRQRNRSYTEYEIEKNYFTLFLCLNHLIKKKINKLTPQNNDYVC